MKKSVFILISFLLFIYAFADINVKEINLTQHLQLQLNAAGPIITKVDVQRNRIAVLHTNSSMISVIDGETHKVTNIPIAGRGIQHFKDESFFIDAKSGNIYGVGDHCLHVVFPDQKRIQSKRIRIVLVWILQPVQGKSQARIS